jgi:hypothetical protein
MSVNIEELKELDGKKAVIHVIQADDSLKQIEGKIEAVGPQGIAFKIKGQGSVDLFEIEKIEEVQAVNEGPKKIKAKKLAPIEAGKVRAHLVDRHGMPVSKANSMDEKAAEELHNRIDHSDLGHFHKADEPTTQEQAIATAQSSAA